MNAKKNHPLMQRRAKLTICTVIELAFPAGRSRKAAAPTRCKLFSSNVVQPGCNRSVERSRYAESLSEEREQ
jgi:hypothetical protein